MGNRILITGGSGLLALNWAAALRSRAEVILGIHRRQAPMAGVISRFINLESVADFSNVVQDLSPAFVIHTAGLANVEMCESDPKLAHHVNVRLAENVAMACASQGVKLVHISTDHLFSGEEPCVSEDQPVAPLNTYGRTKAEAEERVQNVCPNTLVVRTNFFGWGTAYRKSFSDSVLNRLRAGEMISLFEDVYYTPILASNMALAVHELVNLGAVGVLNIVGEERISKFSFGLRLARKFGLNERLVRPDRIIHNKSLVRRPLDMSLSDSKVSTLLGHGLGGIDCHIGHLAKEESSGLALELKSL